MFGGVDPSVLMPTCARVNNRDILPYRVARQHFDPAVIEPEFELGDAHQLCEIGTVVRKLKPRAQHVLPPAQFCHQALAPGLRGIENGEPWQPADREQPGNMALHQP